MRPPSLLLVSPDRTVSRRAATAALALALASALVVAPERATAQGAAAATASTASEPFTVEYYYKIKWGFTDEWMELYRRNHYPVLVKQQELGRIVRMSAATPLNHAGEANRWDLRFTIVWKDAATAHDDFDSSSIIKALYPDQAKFRREEQRRFELLLEHMDIPVKPDDLLAWKKQP